MDLVKPKKQFWYKLRVHSFPKTILLKKKQNWPKIEFPFWNRYSEINQGSPVEQVLYLFPGKILVKSHVEIFSLFKNVFLN